jgi:hypothetical protein
MAENLPGVQVTPVYCSSCGGPGKLERDWLGDERVICDAYRACDLDGRLGRHKLADQPDLGLAEA